MCTHWRFLPQHHKAYYHLPEKAAADYPQLKAEILARSGVTTAVQAQQYHKWRYQKNKTPRSQLYDLIHLAGKWLRMESRNPEEILEVLVIDQYMRGLPPDLRTWVSQNEPFTYDEVVAVVERQRTARELTRPVKEEAPQVKLAALSPRAWVTGPPGGPRWKKRGAEGSPEATKCWSTEGEEDHDVRLPKPRDGGMPRAPYRFYACGEWGHIAAQYPCSLIHLVGGLTIPTYVHQTSKAKWVRDHKEHKGDQVVLIPPTFPVPCATQRREPSRQC
uniref:SCAN box domain-containing protein n=1 Tax=Gopherus agassizii TaxID=38772 RepID=A0A452HIS5_9SAUR